MNTAVAEFKTDYVGVVSEVNAPTGFVHLTNKTDKRAVSIIDRTGRFGVGDTVSIQGHLTFQPMEARIRQKYEVAETDVPNWKHAIAAFVKVVNHEVVKTIVDVPKIAPVIPIVGPYYADMPDVPVWVPGMLGTFWRDTKTQAVLEITGLSKDGEGLWQAEVKYHDLGVRRRKESKQTLGRILSDYAQVVKPKN